MRNVKESTNIDVSFQKGTATQAQEARILGRELFIRYWTRHDIEYNPRWPEYVLLGWEEEERDYCFAIVAYLDHNS